MGDVEDVEGPLGEDVNLKGVEKSCWCTRDLFDWFAGISWEKSTVLKQNHDHLMFQKSG